MSSTGGSNAQRLRSIEAKITTSKARHKKPKLPDHLDCLELPPGPVRDRLHQAMRDILAGVRKYNQENPGSPIRPDEPSPVTRLVGFVPPQLLTVEGMKRFINDGPTANVAHQTADVDQP